MPKFFLTIVWNINRDNNAKRIEEFEAFRKRAETKGTITNWVIEYQPSNGHAHAHCTYDTLYTNVDTVKYSFKRKGLHVDVIPVKKGTEKHLEGYIHKPATKERHYDDDYVAERKSLSPPPEEDDVPCYNATPEWKEKQITYLRQSIKPIPLAAYGDMFNFF